MLEEIFLLKIGRKISLQGSRLFLSDHPQFFFIKWRIFFWLEFLNYGCCHVLLLFDCSHLMIISMPLFRKLIRKRKKLLSSFPYPWSIQIYSFFNLFASVSRVTNNCDLIGNCLGDNSVFCSVLSTCEN